MSWFLSDDTQVKRTHNAGKRAKLMQQVKHQQRRPTVSDIPADIRVSSSRFQVYRFIRDWMASCLSFNCQGSPVNYPLRWAPPPPTLCLRCTATPIFRMGSQLAMSSIEPRWKA